jgi:hypothetical protein
MERYLPVLMFCSMAMFLWCGLLSVLLAMQVKEKGVFGIFKAFFMSIRIFHSDQDSELQTKMIKYNRAQLLYLSLTGLLLVLHLFINGTQV